MTQISIQHFFKRQVTIPLCAVFLVAAGNVSTLNDPPPPNLRPLNSTEKLFKLEGNETAETQEFVLETATTEEILKPILDKSCYRFGEGMEKAKQVAPAIIALAALKQNSDLGEEVFQLIYKDKIRLCSLNTMPEGTEALYNEYLKSLILGKYSDPAELPYVIAHESLHYAQHKNLLSSSAQNTNMQEQLRQVLTIDDHGINVIYDSKVHHVLETSYQEGIKNNLPPQDALRAAGKAVFEQVFENDSWRRFYIDRTLINYYIAVNEKNGDFTGETLTQDYINTAGKLDKAASFTEGGKVPAFEKLFKNDQKMYWVYEAAHCQLHALYDPKDSKELFALFQKALDGNNPYLGLPISRLLLEKKQQDRSDDPTVKKYDYLYQFLDAKLEEKNQSALKKDSPVQTKKPAV
jgi:hypothetical protein